MEKFEEKKLIRFDKFHTNILKKKNSTICVRDIMSELVKEISENENKVKMMNL